MGIRPVDMQVVVHKTQDTHQAKQSVVSKQENELAAAQAHNKEEAVKKQKMVNTLEQKEQAKIRNDKKRDEEKHSKKKKNKKEKKESELKPNEAETKVERVANSATGSKFDMKV